MELIQKDFEEMMSKTSDYSYAYTIVPFCKRMLDFLGDDPFKWPILTEFHLIDIYYETIYHYYTLHIDKPFPFKLLVLLMLYRPFIYHVACITKQYNEIEKFNERICKEIDVLFKKRLDNERVVNLKEIMNMRHISTDKLSSIAYLHYLVGFKFNKSMVGIDKERVINLAHDNHANIIYINILHNLPFHDKTVYVYRESTEKIGFQFLVPEVVKKYKPIELTSVPETYKFDRLFDYENVTEANMFVINYNDHDFTVLTKDNEPYILNQKQSQRLMNGALPMLISNEDFINYAEQSYHKLIPRFVTSEKIEIKEELPRFAEIYNEYIRLLLDSFIIENKLHLSRFCDRLSEVLDGHINKTEKDLFVFYCRLYSWSGPMDKHMFVEYMKSYFDPPEM